MLSPTHSCKVEKICVSILKQCPLNARLQGPKFFFELKDVVISGQKFLFKIHRESTMVLADRLLDAIETSKKPLFPKEDIVKGINVPSLDSVNEVLHSCSNVIGMAVLGVLNDGWKGWVVEPHGFKAEGFRAKRLRGG